MPDTKTVSGFPSIHFCSGKAVLPFHNTVELYQGSLSEASRKRHQLIQQMLVKKCSVLNLRAST